MFGNYDRWSKILGLGHRVSDSGFRVEGLGSHGDNLLGPRSVSLYIRQLTTGAKARDVAARRLITSLNVLRMMLWMTVPVTQPPPPSVPKPVLLLLRSQRRFVHYCTIRRGELGGTPGIAP